MRKLVCLLILVIAVNLSFGQQELNCSECYQLFNQEIYDDYRIYEYTVSGDAVKIDRYLEKKDSIIKFIILYLDRESVGSDSLNACVAIFELTPGNSMVKYIEKNPMFRNLNLRDEIKIMHDWVVKNVKRYHNFFRDTSNWELKKGRWLIEKNWNNIFVTVKDERFELYDLPEKYLKKFRRLMRKFN